MPSPGYNWITLTWYPDELTAVVEFDYDADRESVAADFVRLADEDTPHLRLDLSGIPFISSALLGSLITLHRRFQIQRRRITLVLPPDFREVFRTTKLDRIIEIEDG